MVRSTAIFLLLLTACSTKPATQAGSTTAAAPAAEEEDPTLVRGGYDQAEMDAAIAKARATVDTFIVELEKGQGDSFSVKAPITDGEETEHFWLGQLAYKDGTFSGTIDNVPGVVGNVKLGDKWTIAKADISDWMFMRDGKMHGNYTMRPLLKTLPPDEAAMYRSMLAEP